MLKIFVSMEMEKDQERGEEVKKKERGTLFSQEKD